MVPKLMIPEELSSCGQLEDWLLRNARTQWCLRVCPFLGVPKSLEIISFLNMFFFNYRRITYSINITISMAVFGQIPLGTDLW